VVNLLRMRLVPILAALLALAAESTAASDSVGGLRVDCRGERTQAPTVILESGAFGTADDWARVLPDLSGGGRVCAYDRGGVGGSAPRAGGSDVTAIAEELAGLLDRLDERGPVILVGHSNGALYAEAFAALWPERVAGLVYVNGVTSNDITEPLLLADLARERRLSSLAADAGALGLAPLGAVTVVKAEGLPAEATANKRRALSSPRRLRVARNEDRAIVPGLFITANLGGSPRSIPTVSIYGGPDPGSALATAWRRAEAVPSERAVRGWTLEAVGATHVSPLARDRAYVIAAVNWLRSMASPHASPDADVGH
jgi:pimeloyl-ACP methyl ester carboxylesterase